MTIEEQVLSMKCGDFALGKVVNIDRSIDVFPQRIAIIKWVDCEPHEVYSMTQGKEIMLDRYNFVIADLVWKPNLNYWAIDPVGNRFKEYRTRELNEWILDFCNRYMVVDGKLTERGKNV